MEPRIEHAMSSRPKSWWRDAGTEDVFVASHDWSDGSLQLSEFTRRESCFPIDLR